MGPHTVLPYPTDSFCCICFVEYAPITSCDKRQIKRMIPAPGFVAWVTTQLITFTWIPVVCHRGIFARSKLISTMGIPIRTVKCYLQEVDGWRKHITNVYCSFYMWPWAKYKSRDISRCSITRYCVQHSADESTMLVGFDLTKHTSYLVPSLARYGVTFLLKMTAIYQECM